MNQNTMPKKLNLHQALICLKTNTLAVTIYEEVSKLHLLGRLQLIFALYDMWLYKAINAL